MKLHDPTDDAGEHFEVEEKKTFVCMTALAPFDTTVRSSKGDGVYQVVFDPEAGWSCDCKGFQYRAKCRHIDQAKMKVCHWNVERVKLGTPEVVAGEPACPLCKGDVVEAKSSAGTGG